jgi:cytochrome P450
MGNAEAPVGFFESAPLTFDRAEGWRYFREPGEVYERDGIWFLTSERAVRFAHQHPEIFSSAKAFDNLGSPVTLIPLAVDPPDHVRYRRLLDPLLAPRVIGAIEPELRRQVREIIGAFAGRGEAEIMADLANLYPTQVFLTLFGLPLEDRDTFIDWVRTIVEAPGSTASEAATTEAAAAGMALFGYLQGFIVAKRAEPGDDMLSTILAMGGDDAWTDDEVLGLCFLFTLAGLDTVTASIGFVMARLAADAALRQRVVDEPDLAGPVIEEVLRLELPAPFTPRVVLRDVEVCGVTIPAGSFAFLVLGSANREGDGVRANPDEIELTYADRGHLSFGGGIHRCLGSHLARRELRIVVEELHRMIPEYTLAEGFVPRIHWPSGTLHLTSLPITFPADPAAPAAPVAPAGAS